MHSNLLVIPKENQDEAAKERMTMSASQHLFLEVAKEMLGDEVGDVCEISSLDETRLLVSACLRIDHTKAFGVLGEKGKRGVAIVEC